MEAFLLGLIAAILASGPTNTPVVPPQQAQQATQHKLFGSLAPAKEADLSPEASAIYAHIRKRNSAIPPEYAAAIAQAIVLQSQIAADEPISPFLVAAVLSRESSFQPDAVSSSGALGIAQLLPTTAKDLGVADPLDPLQGIQGCIRYLVRSQKTFKDYEHREELVVASYWQGVGGVKRNWPDADFPDKVKSFVKYILDLRDELAQQAEKWRTGG